MNHINRDEAFNKHLGGRTMTRAEEVADKFVSEWIAFDGFGTRAMAEFTAKSLSSLPEFQPGRTIHDMLAIIHCDGGHYEQEHGFEKAFQDAETKVLELLQPGRDLTGDDIRKLCDETHGMPPTYWEFIAAELNKIRAPKTCAEPQSYIKAIEKERAELQSQLEALKSKPVGVTKEQVKEAFAAAGFTTTFADETYEKIAAALSPKWIKCSDRMPDMYQKVFWLQERDNLIENGYYAGHVHPATTHWMPRYVPEPPKDEESELVRHLEKSMVDWDAGSREEIIQIVKEFEKGEKK